MARYYPILQQGGEAAAGPRAECQAELAFGVGACHALLPLGALCPRGEPHFSLHHLGP